jgi:hypothetical protein
MSSRTVSVPRSAYAGPRQHSEISESPAEPFILRLDSVPATAENRYRIREHVRHLNRSLEESGTPFRLRLL